jgi:protein-disulfide isomerase
MHDRIFANQRAMERESLLAHASALGPDSPGSPPISTARAQAVLDRDQAEAAKVGVDGTPTFFVNGTPLVGAQPIEAFTAAPSTRPWPPLADRVNPGPCSKHGDG